MDKVNASESHSFLQHSVLQHQSGTSGLALKIQESKANMLFYSKMAYIMSGLTFFLALFFTQSAFRIGSDV